MAHYQSEIKIDLIKHLTLLFEEVQQFYETRSPRLMRQCVNREAGLLEKYRSAYTPFEEKNFFELFDTTEIPLLKGYYTAEEFNALPKEVTALTEQEVSTFCMAMDDLLSELLYKAYKEDPTKTKTDSTIEKEESDGTEMQKLLAVHYLLKAGFGIEARGSNSVSQFTQLAHLLLGKNLLRCRIPTSIRNIKSFPTLRIRDN